MRQHLVVMAMVAAALAGCGRYDVRSFEETQAQFTRQRPQLEALVAKIQRCGEFYAEVDQPCSGDISRNEILADMRRLGLRDASSRDGTSVQLVNGDDGSRMFGTRMGVMSGMIRYAAPQPYRDGAERPLTPPPHHWFYTQHD